MSKIFPPNVTCNERAIISRLNAMMNDKFGHSSTLTYTEPHSVYICLLLFCPIESMFQKTYYLRLKYTGLLDRLGKKASKIQNFYWTQRNTKWLRSFQVRKRTPFKKKKKSSIFEKFCLENLVAFEKILFVHLNDINMYICVYIWY